MTAKKFWTLTLASVVLALIIFIGVGSYGVLRDAQVEPATEAEASEAFENTRRSFRGQPPVLRPSPDGWTTGRNMDQLASTGRRIESVHVLLWDAGADQLARIQIPFWFLEFFPMDRPVSLLPSGSAFGPAELVITVEDLRRYGPGLIVDHIDTDGSRALIWAD